MTNLRAPNGATTDMVETCDRPIRDRSGEELPGVRCNLGKGHLGRCAQLYDATTFFDKPGGPGNVFSDVPGFKPDATVTPSEPSSESGIPVPSRAR